MPMPFVSKEIIESVRLQAMREADADKLYCIDVMSEMAEENPFLHEAIKDTITMLVNKFELDVDNTNDYHFMINIANLTMSVYSSIKQQIICNELEDK